MTILRLGHRLHRDFRVTTHCALVARAFGASRMIFSGDRDDDIIKSIEKVNRSWGGRFQMEYSKHWRGVIEEMREGGAFIILATMYGIDLSRASDMLREEARRRALLVIVGSEKMRGEIFRIADLNVAVLNQPHSEVAAIAVILDRVYSGEQREHAFEGAKLEIVPSERGKMVRSLIRPQDR